MLKKLWKNGGIWPLGILVVMTIFVAVNLAFVTIAVQNKPQLVSRNYYAEGDNLRAIAERSAARAATGWQVSVRHLPLQQADTPLVEIHVRDAAGLPCDSLAGDVAFYRPSDLRLDLAPLPLRAAGPGRYLIFLPHPLEHGAWQAVIHVQRGSQLLHERVAFSVSAP